MRIRRGSRRHRHRHVALLLLLALLVGAAPDGHAQELPAGTFLSVRLRHPLYSYSARRGQPIRALLIAPIVLDGVVRLPAGAELQGTITDARKVGLGVRRERARLGLQFDHVRLPTGETLPLAARLHSVLNARESLDAEGRITGIRATSALGYQMSGWLIGAATSDALLMLFALAGGTAIIRFPESEIMLPAGTELLLQTSSPFSASRTFPTSVQPVARTPDDQAQLRAFVATLPFRTSTPGGTPSDLTNVLLVGESEAITRAFHAAGWFTASELNATTAYRTFRSMAENKGYAEAPMSLLQLDGRSLAETWQKGLNTFSARHHLRLFPSAARYEDQPVWPISSTQDIGIGFSRKARNIIHIIDPTIDNERNKIVNDLAFTGCVDAVEMVPRPFVPKDAHNATHDPLLTDGDMAVVQLNACATPRPFVQPAEDVAIGPALGNPVQRGFRRFFLSMKHQLWRGNVVYASVSRAVTGVKMVFGHKPEKTPERTLIIDGVAYSVAADPHAPLPEAEDGPASAPAPASAVAAGEPAGAAPLSTPTSAPTPTSASASAPTPTSAPASGTPAGAWRPVPSIEMFFGPSLSRTEPLGTFAFGFSGAGQSDSPDDDVLLLVAAPLRITRAGGVTPRVSVLQGRWLAHEIAYDYSRATLRFDFAQSTFDVFAADGSSLLSFKGSGDSLDGALVVRSLGYSVAAHLRPRESRVRPYVLVGPELTAYRLREGAQRNSRLLGRVGLGNVGSVIGALRAGRRAPLDGGTIYRWGLTYGVGLRARLTETWGLRADLRETLIETPDFASIDPADVTGSAGFVFSQETTRMRRRSFTIGATFGF